MYCVYPAMSESSKQELFYIKLAFIASKQSTQI